MLVERFRHEFNTRFKKSVRFVSQEVMRAMAQYHWPGNIRELRHVMERAFVVAQGPILSLADLPPQIAGRQPAAQSGLEPAIPPQSHAVQPGGLPSNGHAAAGAGDEVAQIRAVLAENGGNIGRAATQLKMHRTTLWRKMRQYGIEA
ncbi:hypothetical protein HYR69_05075 [Candidatus Sumerlaeota bacterium]|nr:hypothetical protein [Candidatus Sumerlaeota bacterium]